jgi:hypothetical protein
MRRRPALRALDIQAGSAHHLTGRVLTQAARNRPPPSSFLDWITPWKSCF